MIQNRINITTILFATIVTVSSCKTNKLPRVDYADNIGQYHLQAILNYHDGKLRLMDSIIEDFVKFEWEYRENLPEMDHIRWLYGISIDKRTQFHEIDSIFRIIEKAKTYWIFLLVNDIKDTLGFTMPIPNYSYYDSDNFEVPDTLFIDNFIELKENLVYINGERTERAATDYYIKEIVFKKQPVWLAITKSTKYESMINILSCYHKYRQHFKELYAELEFNKEYSMFYELPEYFSGIKYKVDQEYRSMIYLFDSAFFPNKTIIVNNKYTHDYAP